MKTPITRLPVFTTIALLLLYTITFINSPATMAGSISGEDPQIVIGLDSWMPVFNAGEQTELNIPIKNVRSGAAKDVTMSLVVSDLNNFPFEMKKMSFSNYISHFSGNSNTSFSLKVNVPANVKPGTYPLEVSVSYKTETGGGGQETATVYVKIVNAFKQPELKLFNVTLPGEKLAAGQTAPVKLNMQNDSDLLIKNAELHLSGFSPTGISLEQSPDTQYVNSIEPHKIHPVTYQLHAHAKMESGTYPLDLTIKFRDSYDREYEQQAKVFITVAGKDSQDDLTPRIILDNYSIGGEYAQCGQSFPLTMFFLNTSTTTTVKNTKISLASEGDVFAPVGSSNSFYIPSIEPGSSIEKTIVLKPKNNAEHQIYTLTANIDYQDSSGNKYDEKDTISIPVIKELKLVTSAVETPAQVFVGSPTGLSIDIYNTGRSLIRNLMVRTEGDFEVQDGNLFIGNIEAGKDDYYDVTVIPQKEGSLKGQVIMEYDDELGQHFTLTKAFTLQAMPAPEPPHPGKEMAEKAGPKSELKKWMIPAGIGMLLILAVILMVRRRRRKKLEEVTLDE
ncbi:COG1361 S-layer family protein [Syntrophomonas erecta]